MGRKVLAARMIAWLAARCMFKVIRAQSAARQTVLVSVKVSYTCCGRGSRLTFPSVPRRSLLILAFATVCLVWGSTYLAIRVALFEKRFELVPGLVVDLVQLSDLLIVQLNSLLHVKHVSLAGFFDVVPVGRDPDRVLLLGLDLEAAGRRVEDHPAAGDLERRSLARRDDGLEDRPV